MHALSMLSNNDFFLVDDRFYNQHHSINVAGTSIQTICSLDILEELLQVGQLTKEGVIECNTHLRRSGYCFIPLDAQELEQCLLQTTISGGNLLETAELRSIRESILRIRMGDWLQLPDEDSWFSSTLNSLLEVLKNVWSIPAVLELKMAQSNWLYDQVDLRGWAHRLGKDLDWSTVRSAFINLCMKVLTIPIGEDQINKQEYWRWAEGKILEPLKEEDPKLFDEVVQRYHDLLQRIVNADLGTK